MDADNSEVQCTLPDNRYLPYCFDRERVVEEQVEEPEPKIKKERNPAGMVYGGTSAVFQLQTEPLNTLTEQQQRLFRTQCYFGAASVFSVWPGG